MSLISLYDGEDLDDGISTTENRKAQKKTVFSFIKHTVNEYYIAKKVYMLTSFMRRMSMHRRRFLSIWVSSSVCLYAVVCCVV